jgi:hypothetical protein
MASTHPPLSPDQQRTVAAALESLTFLKLVARVQGVGIAKLSQRDLENFVRAADDRRSIVDHRVNRGPDG